jgi:hypothetical protein
MLNQLKSLSKENKIIFGIGIVLSTISIIYLTKGFYYLLIDQTIGAKDLHSRWQEQQYIYRGLYPYLVRKGSPLIDNELGPVVSGGYPPWSFFTGFLTFPPISWGLTRLYHALINIVSLLIIAIFSYKIGRNYGQVKSWFTVITCLSMASYATTLADGQYGIIVITLLILMYWSIEKKHDIIAGLMLGLALVKPNISATFFLILLIYRLPKGIIICCAYLLISVLSISKLVNHSPIYLFKDNIMTIKHFVLKGYSGVNLVNYIGIEPLPATIILATISLIFLAIIMYKFRDLSMLSLFALASVVGRLFTYHLSYDNVMLIFLLLALLDIVLSKPKFYNTLMLALVLLSLLIPAQITNLTSVKIAQAAIWIIGAIYILHYKKRVPSLVSLNNHSN